MSVNNLPVLRPEHPAWNKERIIGQKRPLLPKHVWSIRVRLEMADNRRDLALFNMAIDSKLRGCDLVCLKVRDVFAAGRSQGARLRHPEQDGQAGSLRDHRNDAPIAWRKPLPDGLHEIPNGNWRLQGKMSGTWPNRRRSSSAWHRHCGMRLRQTNSISCSGSRNTSMWPDEMSATAPSVVLSKSAFFIMNGRICVNMAATILHDGSGGCRRRMAMAQGTTSPASPLKDRIA